jgi:hypothetical protein
MLHLIGMDHKRLTYFYNGRNMRLTDWRGNSSRRSLPELPKLPK